MRRVWWFAAAYAVVLMLLAPHLSFWLDEVLTLTGAAQPDLASMMENLRKQQGATPLAFLIPHWTIGVLGLSELSARLPSILASALCLPAMYWLARRAGLEAPLAMAVFAFWPLQLRYALEARPYAIALCLGMWLTVAFLGRTHWAPYAALTIAMGLTHPYSLVIPVAHLIWSMLYDRQRTPLPLASLAAACCALIPWYLHFSDGWRAQSALQQLAVWNPRAALVFLREISGSGYAGAALLLAGILLGARAAINERRFWVLAVLVPLLTIPFLNVAFDYFFAIRQVLYIVPALVLLTCAGPRWVPALFLAVSLYSDITWYLRPREDWAAASSAIAVASDGACVQFVGDSQKLFVFFRPELATRPCGSDPSRVVLAGSTYESEQSTAQAALVARGLRRISEQRFVAPIIEVYAR